MCGVVAVASPGANTVTTDQMGVLCDLLAHRGPDRSAFFIWDRDGNRSTSGVIGLGQTRLSVLDLSRHGDQPMLTDDGQVALSYNGETYNFRQLRTELETLGHHFESSGDTEVVLKAYLEWGTDAFSRFDGMFAIILHDLRQDSLIVARDRYGIKPLYYGQTPTGIAVASEMKAVLAAGASARVNARSVLRHSRFGGGAVEDETVYSAIRSVQPGTFACVSLTKPDLSPASFQAFTSPEPEPLSEDDLSFDEASRHLRQLLLESIEAHLVSDVPVGVALSGGVDSSAIVCCAREVLGPKAELHTFTYSATGTRYDERRWAEIVGKHAGATMHFVTPGDDDLRTGLDVIASKWDEPLPSTSAYAQYRVFEEARSQGITVMLDGQGADELFAGYDRYRATRLASLVKSGDLRGTAKFMRACRKRGERPHALLLNALDCLLPPQLHPPARRMIGRGLFPEWVDKEWFVARGARLEPVHSTQARNVLRDQLNKDFDSQMLPALLRYEDTNSMLSSIESRVPFVYRPVVEFCRSLPESYLVDDAGTTKAVLRHSLRGIVPDEVLDRPDKIGFQPPPNDWLGSFTQDPHTSAKTLASVLPLVDFDGMQTTIADAAHDFRQAESAWRAVLLASWATSHDVDWG